MRVVVCDEDELLRGMVGEAIARTGHEVAGIADTTAAALGLIEAARPDVVIVDMWLGFDSDFDIIQSAIDVGARPIVFSHHGDAEVLATYSVQPAFVPKPDLSALEQVLSRLDVDEDDHRVVAHERRDRPARAASGPRSNGLEDAHAFFEAISEATAGDGLISIDLRDGADALAGHVAQRLRDGDRVLLLPTSVRLYLPGGGDEGIRSVLDRVAAHPVATSAGTAAAVVVAPGEHGADAFGRLKNQT
jgi:chemotaxis response regulator CheB